MSFYRGKRVLVAGGTGLIGRPLVELLVRAGAKVRIASMDDPSRAHPGAEFRRVDLLQFKNALDVCDGIEAAFNLLGVKGSPAMAAARPASYFVPTITLDTNLMEAARQCGAERFLFASSIAVYPPADVFVEDDVWKRFPSTNDWYPAWAKRMGEMQADAYRIEFGWDKIAVVRPANVYGSYDNFDLENAMVVPSLVRRVAAGEDPLRVWGDGSARRDVVHARDVAEGMMIVMEKMPGQPVNLGSGGGVTIRELVETLLRAAETSPRVEWETARPTGDPIRVLDITRARSLGYAPRVSLEEGLRETLAWYRAHQDEATKRYDVFESGRSARLLT